MADIINSLPPGTILLGPKNRYQIQRPLGQGTFGITYLATTDMQVSGQMGSFTTQVQVAVKEFFMREINGRKGTEVTASSQGGYFIDYKKKFLHEAENLAKLRHKHIVKVLESFEANGTAYYAMEYLEGGSLESYILQRGALPEAEALGLARQIGDALECMHAHQMLHLDLKPANVMRRASGEAVLIDFGLSKQFDKDGNPESSTTIGGGTPGYAPIEQANYQRGDGLPVTMDVYAFGATLYRMLTGERPPEASEVLNDGLPTFVLERRGVSAQTISAVEKAMAPMRRKRYQSVRAAVEGLAGNSPRQSVDNLSDETTFRRELRLDRTTIRRELPRPKPVPAFDWKQFLYKIRYVLFVALGGMLAFLFFLLFDHFKHPVQSDEGETEVAEVGGDSEESTSSQTITANGVNFKMILVEGGSFTMGATSEQGSDAFSDEKPAHQVTVSSYYIGETEVTQALWQAVMGSNPSNFKGDNRPVERVSWDDCKTFISKLNSLTGKNFRLPTEAEWEYAARGGNKSQGYKYSGSNTLGNVAWYEDNSGEETHQVKTKSPNELGIYDMSGNVREWCQDWYGDYSSSSQTNPTGASSGSSRVCRGGSWRYNARFCRVSYRINDMPDFRYDNLGLRLVL